MIVDSAGNGEQSRNGEESKWRTAWRDQRGKVQNAILFSDHVQGEFSDMIYYSFVTMTTLGYGDITPVSRMAKNLALLEAVWGQTYLAVLVARLVGLHLSSSGRSD